MSEQRRRRRLALLIAVLPIAVGLAIIALGFVFGRRSEGERHGTGAPPAGGGGAPSRPAVAPARTGTPAPRVTLRDARTGTTFDSAGPRGRPYGVVFVSTRCAKLGDRLRKVLAQLGDRSAPVALLAISADPWRDSERRVRAWLRRHGEPASLHYLTGSERALRPYWRAWGLLPPNASSAGSVCEGPAPVHLVSAAGVNAGVVDLRPGAQVSALANDLKALTR